MPSLLARKLGCQSAQVLSNHAGLISRMSRFPDLHNFAHTHHIVSNGFDFWHKHDRYWLPVKLNHSNVHSYRDNC